MNDYLLTKMSVQDCIANLDNRVKLLESCYLTGGQQPELDAGSLLQRVQALLTKVQDIEAEFPEIKACSEALVKIQPLLGQKRHGLKSVQDKVNQLLAKKQTITEGVSLLQNIDGLQHVINTEQFAGES